MEVGVEDLLPGGLAIGGEQIDSVGPNVISGTQGARQVVTMDEAGRSLAGDDVAEDAVIQGVVLPRLSVMVDLERATLADDHIWSRDPRRSAGETPPPASHWSKGLARGLLDRITDLIDSRYGGRITKRYLTELRVATRTP